MTIADAVAALGRITVCLQRIAETSPEFVASIGGQDALAARCEMTAVGAIPRLGTDEWQRLSLEYHRRRFG